MSFVYTQWIIASKQTILTLEEAVKKVLGCAESEEADIVILPPEQGDTYATDFEEDDEFLKQELYIKDITGPIMKKLCLNLSQMLDQVQMFVKPQSRKKTETVYWKKKKNLKKLQENKLEQSSESHPYLLFLESVELFRLFVKNEICEMIRCETERNGAQKKSTNQYLRARDRNVSGYHHINRI